MKIDFDEELKDMDGKALTEQVSGAEVAFNLKAACVRALTNPLQADQNITGEDAFKRLELARKVNKGGEQEIEPAQAVMIADRAAKMFGVLVSGQVYERLR